jgi:hypothetical protein
VPCVGGRGASERGVRCIGGVGLGGGRDKPQAVPVVAGQRRCLACALRSVEAEWWYIVAPEAEVGLVAAFELGVSQIIVSIVSIVIRYQSLVPRLPASGLCRLSSQPYRSELQQEDTFHSKGGSQARQRHAGGPAGPLIKSGFGFSCSRGQGPAAWRGLWRRALSAIPAHAAWLSQARACNCGLH